MHAWTLIAALWVGGAAVAATEEPNGVSLSQSQDARRVSLLGGLELDATLKPSASPPLRLTDGLRYDREGPLRPLDMGGGLSSDVRQILSLIIGFIPGFGLGHLIAGDKDGFILFLVIDVALYVLWGVVGFGFFHPFRFIGGAVWLVVHLIQALDAYAEAGGPRIVQAVREQAVGLADLGPGRDSAITTTRAFALTF